MNGVRGQLILYFRSCRIQFPLHFGRRHLLHVTVGHTVRLDTMAVGIEIRQLVLPDQMPNFGRYFDWVPIVGDPIRFLVGDITCREVEYASLSTLIQNRPGCRIEVPVTIVECQNDGFRWGRLPAGAIIEIIIEGNRRVAVGVEGRHLLPERLGRNPILAVHGLGNLMVHENRDVHVVHGCRHTYGILIHKITLLVHDRSLNGIPGHMTVIHRCHTRPHFKRAVRWNSFRDDVDGQRLLCPGGPVGIHCFDQDMLSLHQPAIIVDFVALLIDRYGVGTWNRGRSIDIGFDPVMDDVRKRDGEPSPR